MSRPKKKTDPTAENLSAKPQLILDSDSESDPGTDEFHSAAEAQEDRGGGFKINAEYAKRFEHNKKREELQKLEEKYGPGAAKKRSRFDSSDSDSDSNSEDEDDTAVLATVALDQEIAATLAAIRKKDPRVYDGKTTFYAPIEPAPTQDDAAPAKPVEEKPVYLRDYHLKNLLSGTTPTDDAAPARQTFVQEQDELKRTVVKEMHQAVAPEDDDQDDDGDDGDTGFLVRKPDPDAGKQQPPPNDLPDPSLADQNPDEFLDRFLNSRAWAQNSAYPALESDDSDHEETADAFEAAYNFRFENPSVDQRAALRSYARDAVSANTVRREDKSVRKKAREAKREKREREKEEREREKGRLRKLKTEELMGKFKMIREAAGLEDADGDEEAQAEVLEKLLEGEWSDEQWAEWMAERFGDEYYEHGDRKVRKPEFEDDIDIGDIVPGFEEEAPPAIDDGGDDGGDDEDGGVPVTRETTEDDEAAEAEDRPSKKHTDKKNLQKEQRKKKQKDKELKRKLEAYVEDKFDFEDQIPTSSTATRGFRYRQTTPEAYGLTPIDILTATDQDLNTFVGLKKLASFREPDKKKKDKKRYGKKKRLREWRKDVFGDEDGVSMPANWKPEELKQKGTAEGKVDIRGEVAEGGRKKKRRKKNKS